MMMLISDVFVYFQVVLFAALQNQLASSQKKECPYLRSGLPLRSSPQAQMKTALASLRNNIRRHQTSRAPEIAQDLTEKGGQDILGNMVRAVSETVFSETDAVFRTASCENEPTLH